MRRNLCFVLSAMFILMSLPAFAATVQSVKGKILINRGEGFQPVTEGAQANAGDRLMADAGGSAKVVYPGGCQVRVIPGTVVSVGKQPPCTAPYMSDLIEPAPPPVYSNPLLPFAGTAAVGWGIFCAVEYCQDDDPGRRGSQEGETG